MGGSRVEIVREADEPPIELHQSLDLTITGSRTENWTVGPAVIIEATAEIIQFTPKFYVRVDGIFSARLPGFGKAIWSRFSGSDLSQSKHLVQDAFFTGVRGIVSLAAALAIPFATTSGQPFPGRELILFLTFPSS